MDFEAAVKETEQRMQDSIKRVELQMEQMQEKHQALIANSIAQLERTIGSTATAPVPEPKSEYVTTDDGQKMLVMNMDAVAVLKNVFTLMQEVVDEIK